MIDDSPDTLLERALPAFLMLVAIMTGCASSGSGAGSLRYEIPGAAASAEYAEHQTVRTVQPGDKAGISFLCRLQNGDLVAATDNSAAQQAGRQKSSVFQPRDKEGPLAITASETLPMPVAPKIEWDFEEEILYRLAGRVIGMKAGELRTVNVRAEDLLERRQEDYVIRIARVRLRPREMRMSIDDYRSRSGKSPEAGQPVGSDPAFPGRVEQVTQDEVVIGFSTQAGDVLQTPFGPGRITEKENVYEIEIEAVPGALVRSGPLVGRIAGFDAKYITIDYRNPFGGETLVCDVTVDTIADAKMLKDETEK